MQTSLAAPRTSRWALRMASVAGLEYRLTLIGLGAILIHWLDASLVHPQYGSTFGEQILRAALALAVVGGAASVYPRLATRARAALALGFGLLALVTGAPIHVSAIVKNGASSRDITGVLFVLAGLFLTVLGIVVLMRSVRSWPRRLLLVPAGLVVGAYVVAPVGGAVYLSHLPRTEVCCSEGLGAAYEEVTFPTSDGLTLSGWYIPSRNGAAVMAIHGAGGNRRGPVPHAAMLARHGYGVLLFDLRGHGRSEGRPLGHAWNSERDVAAALEYLHGRPDVDPERIGGLGLSTGAEVLIYAATNGTIKAVVAEGAGVTSLAELRLLPGRGKWIFAPFIWANATATEVLAGVGPSEPLREQTERVPPGRLLLISSRQEAPINRVYAEGTNAEHWEIRDAGHTAGLKTHPEAYEARVIAFFDRALLRAAAGR